MNVRRSAPLLALLLMALPACSGGSSDDTATPTAPTTTSASPSPTPTPTTATTTTPATTKPSTPKPKTLPVAGRKCTVLEEPLRLFPGHKLSIANRGSYLGEVRELQSMINGAGDGKTCIAEDGDFGPVTKAAVIKFQEKNSLVVDGIVGKQTWNQLNLILSH